MEFTLQSLHCLIDNRFKWITFSVGYSYLVTRDELDLIQYSINTGTSKRMNGFSIISLNFFFLWPFESSVKWNILSFHCLWYHCRCLRCRYCHCCCCYYFPLMIKLHIWVHFGDFVYTFYHVPTQQWLMVDIDIMNNMNFQ